MNPPGTDDLDSSAAAALAAIDVRTRRVIHQMHLAVAAFWGREGASDLTHLADSLILTAHDLECAIASWQDLVPLDAATRAVLLHSIIERSGLSPVCFPAVSTALGSGDLDVAHAYRRRYRSDLNFVMESVPVSSPKRQLDARVGLSPERLVDLERSFSRVVLEAGEVLFCAGDAGDSLYVVVTGRVGLLRGDPGADRVAVELGPGEVLGEMAMLTGEPRSATVVAVRDTELYRLSSESVERHLFGEVAAMRRIMTTLARRLARDLSGSRSHQASVHSIALVAAGGTSTHDVVQFAAAFARFLEKYLKVAVLSPRLVEANFGPGVAAPGDPATITGLAGWLSDFEVRHDLVLYTPSAGADGGVQAPHSAGQAPTRGTGSAFGRPTSWYSSGEQVRARGRTP